MEIEQIKNHLRRALVGEKLQYIVRSCELIDFGFGELFRRKNSRGYEREVASYALHLLCPFRIAMEGRCLTGSEDLYKNASPSNGAVDLGVQDSCVFDKKLERIRHFLTEETVTEVTITEDGDIDLQLTTLRITAFCTGSDEDEMWRFFEVGTGSPHIVRNGCGYELI